MLKKIYDFIINNKMLDAGDTVVCGLSGGADSVALLLSLKELSAELGINVEALHVNHCLRGAESNSDEEFCRDLCSSNDIRFTAVSCNVKALAEKEKLSTEEAARVLRYSAFASHSEGKKIATAHNANDNLETVILNLARGTGVKGLAGIPHVRDNIIRPMLTVTRAEIEHFLAERGQSYVTDSTNLSDDYTRNKIRHIIIPALSGINSSVIATSVNTIENIRQDNMFLELSADNAEKQCRNGNELKGLSGYEPSVRKRCIARLLSDNKLPYSNLRLDKADSILLSGGKINISGNIYLIGSSGTLSLREIKQPDKDFIEKPFLIGENTIYSGISLLSEILECDDLKKFEAVHKKSTFYLIDYDKIKGRVVVRSRKFGDKIRLKGRSFTSSVKKLINEKIPEDKKASLHFLEDEEGTVFAEGLGIADRVAPDESTEKYLVISIIES